jgi:hypothetical protein
MADCESVFSVERQMLGEAESADYGYLSNTNVILEDMQNM